MKKVVLCVALILSIASCNSKKNNPVDLESVGKEWLNLQRSTEMWNDWYSGCYCNVPFGNDSLVVSFWSAGAVPMPSGKVDLWVCLQINNAANKDFHTTDITLHKMLEDGSPSVEKIVLNDSLYDKTRKSYETEKEIKTVVKADEYKDLFLSYFVEPGVYYLAIGDYVIGRIDTSKKYEYEDEGPDEDFDDELITVTTMNGKRYALGQADDEEGVPRVCLFVKETGKNKSQKVLLGIGRLDDFKLHNDHIIVVCRQDACGAGVLVDASVYSYDIKGAKSACLVDGCVDVEFLDNDTKMHITTGEVTNYDDAECDADLEYTYQKKIIRLP